MDGGDRTDPGLLLVQKVLDEMEKRKAFSFLGENNQNGVLVIVSFWGSQNQEIPRAKKTLLSTDPPVVLLWRWVSSSSSPICSRITEAATPPKDFPVPLPSCHSQHPDSASYSLVPGFSLMETGWEHQMHPSWRSEAQGLQGLAPFPTWGRRRLSTGRAGKPGLEFELGNRTGCAQYPGGYYNHLIRQGFHLTGFQSIEKWVRAYIKFPSGSCSMGNIF